MHASIKSKGTIISEKVIRRILEEERLIVPCRKKRKYSSYKGEISPAVENLVARDFHADAPNTKWLGTSPDAELVNTMLDDALSSLANGEHPIIHSDRGCHYRWPGWITRMEGAGLTRSMSKKGCSSDNSACEGFFGRLKNEMFYNRSWKHVSIGQFISILDDYIKWYNGKRIKLSLGAMSPIDYRKSIGLAA